MLLQSHEVDATGAVVLAPLPALPGSWREGHVRGLRARGGFIVDLEWRETRLSGGRILSTLGAPAVLRREGKTTPLNLRAGQFVDLAVPPP